MSLAPKTKRILFIIGVMLLMAMLLAVSAVFVLVGGAIGAVFMLYRKLSGAGGGDIPEDGAPEEPSEPPQVVIDAEYEIIDDDENAGDSDEKP